MATVDRIVRADPAAVWAVLANGWTFSNWVVSTATVRAVDPMWPAVGSKLHHSQGIWPVTLDDEAQVAECEDGRRLVLIARGRPLGEARVELEVHPVDGGTRVVMTETPVSGPGAWLHNSLSERILTRRNVEALHRVAAMAERRSSPGG